MNVGEPARIGPNAILQLVPVLDAAIGAANRHALFAASGVALPPPDAGMWPEAEVIRLHRTLTETLPDLAPTLLHDAGLATADYILANRIPAMARGLIRALPAVLGARALTGAIARHAWTFAGSGRFAVAGHHPLTLTITANLLAVGPCCHWHRAVFQRLYGRLVWPSVRVTELACCGAGDAVCQFILDPTRGCNV